MTIKRTPHRPEPHGLLRVNGEQEWCILDVLPLLAGHLGFRRSNASILRAEPFIFIKDFATDLRLLQLNNENLVFSVLRHLDLMLGSSPPDHFSGSTPEGLTTASLPSRDVPVPQIDDQPILSGCRRY